MGEQLARAMDEAARQTGLAKGEIAHQALMERLQPNKKLSAMGRFFGSVIGSQFQ